MSKERLLTGLGPKIRENEKDGHDTLLVYTKRLYYLKPLK